jgi:5-methyltetrahydropteroyltriglutamate--homocysteine methyltransferase
MRGSHDRIITSHVGSLPRPDHLIEANRRREEGEGGDERAFQDLLQSAVTDVVRRQKDSGIAVPGDGEFGKSMGQAVNYRAWLSYSFARLSGLQLDDPPEVPPRPTRPGDLVLAGMARRRDRAKFSAAYDHPDSGISIGRQPFVRPICIGPVAYIGQEAIKADIAHFKTALKACSVDEGFVAERILRFAGIVGRVRVIASTDCGMGGRIHPDIAWAKLEALAQGAEIGSKKLWG